MDGDRAKPNVISRSGAKIQARLSQSPTQDALRRLIVLFA
jgi:hypothetical protein